MTIASAAAAAVPTLPVMAPFRPSAAGGGESGAKFTEQLSGLTVVLPGAGAWRSAGPAKPPGKNAGGTLAPVTAAVPVMAQPLLPYAIHLPSGGAADPGEPTANNSTAAATEGLPQSPVPGPIAIPGIAEGPTSGSGAGPTMPSNGTAGAVAGIKVPGTVILATGGSGGPGPTMPSNGTADAVAPPANRIKGIKVPGTVILAMPSNGTADAIKVPGTVIPDPSPAPQPVAVMPLPAPDLTGDGQTTVAKEAVSRHPGDAAQPTPPADRPAAVGSAQRPQELAFAAKVQPVAAAGNQALSGAMAAAASTRKAVAAAAAPAAAANGPSAVAPAVAAAGASGFPASAMAAFERNLEPASAPRSQPSTPAAPDARELTLQPESLPKPAGPLKDISLQVTQPGKEGVDVRVVQTGSEVRVSVHSGDPGLASGLRQGLSELQGRLEENGYRAEMWRPADSAAPASSTSGAHTASGHSRGGDAQPQSGGSQQDGGRRNQQQPNQPRWVEELESSLTGGEKSSGGSYGFGS